MEQQEQPPPPKKKCEGIPLTEQDNDPCIIIVYNNDTTIFQVCGLNGSVIRTTDAANNPLAPQTVADNSKRESLQWWWGKEVCQLQKNTP